MKYITIKGARCHNLKNINVQIPRGLITVVTGLSGSGKSSLVFDTLHAESQRRYLESLSSYGRDLRNIFDKPEVDDIEGLSPTIAISQKFRSGNPRSTVGTLTEVYDYLRVLYARFGRSTNIKSGSQPQLHPRALSFNSPEGACPDCQGLGSKLEIDPELVIPNKKLSVAEGAIRPLSAIGGARSRWWQKLQTRAGEQGINLDQPVSQLGKDQLDKLLYGDQGIIKYLMQRYQETDSGYLRGKIEHYMRTFNCPTCQGSRLNQLARSIIVGDQTIDQLCNLPIESLPAWFQTTRSRFSSHGQQLVGEIESRLQLLIANQVGYLTLNRNTMSLSGGEIQRIRLAVQIRLGLSGVIYILDEPSVGLHSRDIGLLVATLQKLKKQDNTVVVVEHDREIIKQADYLIDIGPEAGINGGRVVAIGPPDHLKVIRGKSLTAEYLNGTRQIDPPRAYRAGNGHNLTVSGARENNLHDISVDFPLGKLIGVTGVSGSGKSTLVHDILARALRQHFHRSKTPPGHYQQLTGMEYLNKVIIMDQSPIGRSPRSNPATYTGLFTPLRDFFASLPAAKARRFSKGQFSFNVSRGRCQTCSGEGEVKIEMFFLPDIYSKCPACNGQRYNAATLEVKWKDKSIADILDMSVKEAYSFIGQQMPLVLKYLKTLNQVGLGYLRLGQPATTLSGGEAQRVKLATELTRPASGNTMYILDEPTVGLHFADLECLLKILHLLVEKGNTIVIVEHNLDVINSCDWVIDLGPGSGDQGGRLVAAGTPLQIMANPDSFTGRALKSVFKKDQ